MILPAQTLTAGLVRPQPSERWAMYRLICPVIDLALELNGLEAFYEFSQPNGPNKRLSADIAIVRGNQPIWLIEAKKFTQKLHPDLVSCYLKPGLMGAVTNGNHWVFLVQGKTAVMGPVVLENGTIDRQAQSAVVQMLSCVVEMEALAAHGKWDESWQAIARPSGPPVWQINKGTGSRLFAEKEEFKHLQEAVQTALTFVKPNSATEMFLEELLENGAEIHGGSVEVSAKRLIWWLPGGGRGVRVNLEATQLEMLVHNTLLDAAGRARIEASIKLHDKNHAMSTCKASTLAEVRSLVPVMAVKQDDAS